MNKMKLFIASILFCAMGYAGYSAYERVMISDAKKFMHANIEALTTEETGGVNMEYCFEKGSSGSLFTKFQCREGTVVSISVPTTPMGTIYTCEANIGGNLLSKMGYCYKSAK